MANLVETETWEEGIYQFEVTDFIEGGAEGVDNLPHKQLGARTRYLKKKIEAIEGIGNPIASAATTNIGAATGNTLHITGTTTITSFGTGATGLKRTLIFDGILTLTHNATTLILPTGANITTKAGDTAEFVKESSGWRCIDYQRADGTPLDGGVKFASQAEVDEGTVTDKAIAPNTLFGNKRFMIVEEQSAYNSAAVSGAAGINTRTPNTVIYNNTTGSLSEGAISGISGTIKITIEAIASVSGANGNHRVLLYKNDTLLTAGTHTTSNHDADVNASVSIIVSIIDIIATDSLTIKHELNGTGQLQDSYGANYTNTANKVHSRIVIEQLKG